MDGEALARRFALNVFVELPWARVARVRGVYFYLCKQPWCNLPNRRAPMAK
jgi:hypothetical protein